jgi:hypothetical protein
MFIHISAFLHYVSSGNLRVMNDPQRGHFILKQGTDEWWGTFIPQFGQIQLLGGIPAPNPLPPLPLPPPLFPLPKPNGILFLLLID